MTAIFLRLFNLSITAGWIVAAVLLLLGVGLTVYARKKKKGVLVLCGVIVALLGLLSVLSNLGGFFAEVPWLAVGVPAVTGFYFDWFGGCIQAFIFCTLTTIFIKQAAGD